MGKTKKQYFNALNEYKQKYKTEKVILLMQVGDFYEVYALSEKGKMEDISKSNIYDFSEITGYAVKKKNEKHRGKEILMSGTPLSCNLGEITQKIAGNGFYVPVMAQIKDENGEVIDRKEIFNIPPGAGISFVDNDKCHTNKVMCVFFEHIKDNLLKTNKLYCGLSVIDVITGSVNLYQYAIKYNKHISKYDDFERVYSIYSPNQIIIISNYNIQYLIDALNIPENITTVFNVNNKDLYNYKLLKNCKKQIYQEEILQNIYKVPDISCFKESYNLSKNPQATFTLAFLFNYIQTHNKTVIENIKKPTFDNNKNNVFIGTHSLKQLHILNNERKDKFGSILNFVNKCKTNMGRRLLKEKLLHPIKNQDLLNNEYFAIDLFLQNSNFVKDNTNQMKNIIDIEKMSRKFSLFKVKPCEISNFYNSLTIIETIIHRLTKNKPFLESLSKYYQIHDININDAYENIKTIKLYIETNVNLKKIAEIDSIKDVNFFNNDKNVNLHVKKGQENKKHLKHIKRHLESCFTNNKVKMIYNVTEKTPATLQTTFTRYQVIEEKYKCNKLDYMNYFHDLSFQKVSNAKSSKYKIQSPLIDELHIDIFDWSTDFKPILNNAFQKFIDKLLVFNDEINYISKFISIFDFINSRFICAEQYNLCKPEIVDDQDKSYFIAKQIKHPLIYHLNKDINYTCNDISLGKNDDKDGVLLFGINAVGKSSLIRAIGINIIMAQTGMYVPSAEFQYKPYSSIFTRIIGNDDIFKNLSTFMVEMCEFNTILKFSDKNSLILGDELCSGTTTKDAISIFTTGLIKLNEKKSSHIFATHFHEIKDSNYIKQLSSLKKYYMSVSYDNEKEELIYDRVLKEGSGLDQYGIEVCKFIGYDKDFIDLALKIRNDNTILEEETSKYNSNKIKKGLCEMCNIKPAEEIHHLYPQKYADNNGFLPDGNHKNKKSNLSNICRDCHKKETKNNTKKKKIKTSNGVRFVEIS
jgi:DNA mismatch repair protein MutS